MNIFEYIKALYEIYAIMLVHIVIQF